MLANHDLHVHTFLSKCCGTPWSSFPESLIALAAAQGITTVGFADHLWDAAVEGATAWYSTQDFRYVSQIRRLVPPDTGGVRVLFGCESEMRGDGTACISQQVAAQLDFVLMPHSHLHIKGILPAGCRTPQQIADFMVQRFLRSVEMEFVTGIPHAFVPGNDQGQADNVVACISDGQMRDCFGRAGERGVGIEITPNFFPSLKPRAERRFHDETYLRVLAAAKAAGCRFYLGGDAHALHRVGAVRTLQPYLETLGITRDDLHPLVRHSDPDPCPRAAGR